MLRCSFCSSCVVDTTMRNAHSEVAKELHNHGAVHLDLLNLHEQKALTVRQAHVVWEHAGLYVELRLATSF